MQLSQAPARRGRQRDRRGTLDLPMACARAKGLASRPLKFTLTGPHMLAKMLLDKHYRDTASSPWRSPMAGGTGQASRCRCDPAGRGQPARHPDEWEWAAEAINRVLDAKKAKAAVHLCFGNYGGQNIQRGGWEKLIDYLNKLHVDHIVMEKHTGRLKNSPPSGNCATTSAWASASSTSSRRWWSPPRKLPARSSV